MAETPKPRDERISEFITDQDAYNKRVEEELKAAELARQQEAAREDAVAAGRVSALPKST